MHALRRVSAFFGAAAPLGCVTFFPVCQCLHFSRPALRAFFVRNARCGITILSMFRILPKYPAAA